MVGLRRSEDMRETIEIPEVIHKEYFSARTKVWTLGHGWIEADLTISLKARPNLWRQNFWLIDATLGVYRDGSSIYHLGISYSDSRAWNGKKDAKEGITKFLNGMSFEIQDASNELRIKSLGWLDSFPETPR